MYEGFDSYDVFVDSVSDGFTNSLNEFVPPGDELLCGIDGYSALCEGFTGKLSTKKLRAVTKDQLKKIQSELKRGCGLSLTQKQITDCVRGALRQSVGDDSLDNF